MIFLALRLEQSILKAENRQGTFTSLYRAQGISWVKGSVWFVLKFAVPPFSPPRPLSGVQFSKQKCTEPLTQ